MDSTKALIIVPVAELQKQENYLALMAKAEEILAHVKGLQIRSQPNMDDAVAKQVSIKVLRKEVKAIKDYHVNPINTRKTEILDLFKAVSGPLDEADSILGPKMAAFHKAEQEKERKRQEEERRRQEEIRKRAEEEALKAREALQAAETEKEIAEATKKAVEAETKVQESFVKKPVVQKVVPKIRRTVGGGSVSFRTKVKVEVIDESLLPREYLMANTAKIQKVADAGVRQIPGVRIWEDKTPVTRTGKAGRF